MFKLKSFIVYTISLLLALLFSIIVITENTNLVSDLYKNKIIKTIELKSSLGFSMKNLEVKWDGLDTHLIFNDISFYKKDLLYSYSFQLIFVGFLAISRAGFWEWNSLASTDPATHLEIHI